MSVNTQALKAKFAYYNKTQHQIAQAIGMSRNTFRNKMRDGNFKIAEIQRIMKIIPLTMDEVQNISFSS